MAIRHGSLPFREQIDYFRGKLDFPTRHWTDIYGREHDPAFVVAGAMKRDLLADLRKAVERAIADGTTLEQFRADFDTIVARHGWQYRGGRGWRTRVIYETNLRQSYNAGREAQMADPELRKRRPYGLYRHGGSRHPRPEHLAWNGTVLPLDHPWWSTHTPQNGWGCSCKKFMISERDVERMGLKVLDESPPVEWEERTIGQRSPNGPSTVKVPRGIDPGFEYAPGQSRLAHAVPGPRESNPLPDPARPLPTDVLPETRPTQPLPPPRTLSRNRLLPEGLDDEVYIARFLEEFGADAETAVVFRDAIGEAITLGRRMFIDRKSGDLKLHKAGRELTLLVMADAIKSPDEIWVRMEWNAVLNRAVVRRRYLAEFLIEGEAQPALAVFEVGDDGWVGVTGFVASRSRYLDNQRQGVRLYRRGDDPDSP